MAGKSAEDIEMKQIIDKKDEEEKKKFDAIVEKAAETSGFSKLMPYNKPSYLIFVAVINSVINGSAMPVFGLIFSMILSVLTAPPEFLVAAYGPTYMEDEVKKYSLIMAIVAAVSSLASFLMKFSFGTLGNTVTLKIRNLLYYAILEKNIGFFDDRDHASSVLTSSMA